MNIVVGQRQLGWFINEPTRPCLSTVCATFTECVQRTPDAVALELGRVDPGPIETLTYAELDLESTRLAHALIAIGVQPGDRVGFATRRDFDVVIAMLGILKAGAVYVPLDLSYPRQRLDFMQRDSGIGVVAVSQGLSTDFASDSVRLIEIGAPPILDDNAPLPSVFPSDPAYIIYTSGSTGTPKGVVIPHRGVVGLTVGANYAAFGADRRILQMAPVSFDAATFEIWGALLNGGTCVVHPDSGLPDFERLGAVLKTSRVNMMLLIGSVFNAIVDSEIGILAGLEEILIGGEALSVPHVRKACASLKANLINAYGPTEVTVIACAHPIPRDLPDGLASVPIGRPINNTAIAILDEDLNPVAPGEAGELCVAGDGLAIGYHNRPEMTADRFVARFDVPGGRFYRTGDQARMSPGGEIEFLGRRDMQVKIAGHRIELGEVEQVLKAHPKLADAAATVEGASAEAHRIAAWIVPGRQGDPPSVAELRAYVAARLPKYMAPAVYTVLEAMPLGRTGKLDRAALVVPTRERPSLERPFAAPRGEFENFVAESWRELIGLDRVGRHDRFFELGGTSLLAMRFLEICRSKRGLQLGVAEFFDAPTVEKIARIAEERSRAVQSPILQVKPRATNDGVAIVGLAGRFPGAADVESFWEMLLAGRSGRHEVTREDLEAAGENPALLEDPDYVAAAYPLDDVESFDAAFFGFNPREAQLMDPQQRIMLEAAWTVLEDAGIDPRQGSDRIGVFGGIGRNAYLLNNLMSHEHLREKAADYDMLIGNERDFATMHIAYRLGLKGPAVTVQTACSTSGVAVHMAAESLRRGECDLALAGGAKVLSPNRVGYRHVEGGPLSPDGYIRAFDAAAAGMVRGSGVAMVALKRLDEALADGDHIYAVLIGTAVNNDGEAKAGFTAPSASGQASVIAEAYGKAGVSADTVSMVEAHGTGTVLGDPIEVEGLTRVFKAAGQQTNYCALGSVKSNIGHLDAGATAAGLIKAVLALENEVIPPSLNFTEPNPRIAFLDSPFFVAAEPVAWKRGGAPRRAGISSFGLGGTNAHLLIEEAPARVASDAATGPQLLVLSARTETALQKRCEGLADWLEKHDDANLADVAFTLLVGRRRFENRVALVCADREDAIARLRRMAPGEILRGDGAGEAAPVTFLFPGGGAQYAGMACELYAACPGFRDAFDACDAIYRARTRGSLVAAITQTQGPFDQPSVALPALFAVEYAMARLWLSWGVEPSAMIGHSMGEYTAACLAGVFSLEDAIDVVMCRADLFEKVQPGSMLSVALGATELSAELTEDLSIAAINRADLCVVSGPVDAIEALSETLSAKGVETRRVHINVAAHSRLVEPILGEFRDALRRFTLHKPTRRFISNLTGDWISDDEATDPEYWVRHLRSTVLFADGISRLLDDSERIFLEIGPGQTLSTFARQHAKRGSRHDIIATIRHPQESTPDREFLLSAAGRFWLAGGQFNGAAFVGPSRHRVPLPTYPFERTRLWVDAVPFATSGQGLGGIAESVPASSQIQPPPAQKPVFATRHEQILAQLKGIISRLSGLPLDRIDPHATFLELGFDSLFLTQANAALKKVFKIRLTTRQLIETTPRLDSLASYLDEALGADAVIDEVDDRSTPSRSHDVNAAAPIRAEDNPGRPNVRKTAAGLTDEQEAYVDDLILRTVQRTPKAKDQTQASRAVLADPRTVQGFRSRWKEMVYPVLSDRAKGSRIWDIDGNEYIDLVGGYGVTMFGHQPDFVVDAIRAQLDRTLAIGPQTILAGEVAQLVSDLTGMERVAFCNTGSEAVLAAIRMARTVTGKSKIAKFDGHYHGIFDEVQVRGSGQGSRKVAVPSAPGIPPEAVQNTLIMEYGDAEAFDVLRENVDDIALVLVEPVRSRNPDFQPRDYLQQLRKVTEELGIPLLFDEMITGFRSHPGGAQAIFGVRADIVTYGKVAGGGLPIGIVTGSALYMDTLDGGGWRFGDDSVPTSDMTWFAGTFVRHPMALAATKATLEYLKREGPGLQENLNARSTKLANDLNAFLQRVRAPMKVEHFSSVLRVTFTEHQEYADLLFYELRNQGVLTYEGRPIFLTTAHSDEDLATVREVFMASVLKLIGVGLLDGRDPDALRRIPMLSGQQEIWLSTQFSPEASCSYNLCSSLKLKGRFDVDILQVALNDLADRHEALRSVPDRDGLTQTIRSRIDVPLAFEDARTDAAGVLAARVEHAKSAQVTTPFDMREGPLVRSHVLRLANDEHLVLFTVHHVIADGWSCGVLLRDLGKLYEARVTGSAKTLDRAQQLSEFVGFIEQPEQQETRAEARDYWLKLYGGSLPCVEFPSSRPRPTRRDYSARRLEFPIDEAVVANLRKVALESGTTLFASLIGGFSAYLTRLTGVVDNPIGFSAAGQPLVGGATLVGHCVTFLPLRLSAELEQSFAAHLRGIGASVLDALENQNFDFLSFVQEVQPHRDVDWAPLVSVGVNLDPAARTLVFADLEVEAGTVGRLYEGLDLFLNFVEIGASLELQCTYNTALFDQSFVRQRMEEYLRLLASAAAEPGKPVGSFDVIGAEERQHLLWEGEGAKSEYRRDASLADLFRSAASLHADRTALLVSEIEAETLEEQRVSYAELDQLSDQWATRLCQAGVRHGSFVALMLPRSLDLIVAILATLKAGAGYVPIEPGTPLARTKLILDHSEAVALLTSAELADAFVLEAITVLAMDADHPGSPGAAPVIRTKGSDPAYVMYTSGSSGTPKGVIVPHRAVARLVLGARFARLDETRVIAQFAPASFDASTFEIWGALLNGATLVVVPGDQLPGLPLMGQILRNSGVTTLWLTAALFNTIVDENPALLEGVEELITGGEALSVSHICRAQAALPNTTLINGYGPTENTTFSCCYRIPSDFDPRSTSVPIGRPINWTQAFIVDDEMRLVPPGVKGELVVGGDGLALGYLKRPDLTERAFAPDTITVQDATTKGRLYRTGDICRLRSDGEIEFLGRRDDQVKIRGFRIEPGEVEATLLEVRQVRQAALVHEPGPHGGRLIAYVVAADPSLTTSRLAQMLRDRLPRHLVPSRIHLIEELPLSSNGKVDRQELLRGAANDIEDVRNVGSQTPMESELTAIWGDLLQRPIKSVEESFFDLGGHSLMAVRLFDRIHRRYGVDLPISTLFTHSTIRDLADVVTTIQSKGFEGRVDPLADWDTTTIIHPGPGQGQRPLFIVGGGGGNVNNLADLGSALGRRRMVIGIQMRGILGHKPHATIEDMAAENIRYMRRHQPRGPYLLAGYSAGAQTAFEMARQLVAAGERVSELVLLETCAPGLAQRLGGSDLSSAPSDLTLAERLGDEAQLLMSHGLGRIYERASAKLSNAVLRGRVLDLLDVVTPTLARSRRTTLAWFSAARLYRGGSYVGSTSLVLSKPTGLREERFSAAHPYFGWDEAIPLTSLSRVTVESNHLDMVKGEHAEVLAAIIDERIDAAEANS